MKFFTNQKIDDAGRTAVVLEKIILVFATLTVIAMFFGLPLSLLTGSIALGILALGFFGAYKRKTCMLKTYAVIRILELVFHFIILAIAVIVLVFVLGAVVASAAYPETTAYYSEYFSTTYGAPHPTPGEPMPMINTNAKLNPTTNSQSGSSTTVSSSGGSTTTTTNNNGVSSTVTTTVGVSAPGNPHSQPNQPSQPSQPHHQPNQPSQPSQPSPPIIIGPNQPYYTDGGYGAYGNGYGFGYGGIISYEYYGYEELTTCEIVTLSVIFTAIAILGVLISFAYYAFVFYTIVLSFRMASQIKQSAAAYSAVAQKESQLGEIIETPQPFVYVVADPNGNQPVVYQMQTLA